MVTNMISVSGKDKAYPSCIHRQVGMGNGCLGDQHRSTHRHSADAKNQLQHNSRQQQEERSNG